MSRQVTLAGQAPAGQQDWVAPPAGSWSFDGPPNNHIVWSGPETRVCFLTSDGPATKNAQLIASAPDLLEALRATVQALKSMGVSEDDSALRKARAALSRATGSQP